MGVFGGVFVSAGLFAWLLTASFVSLFSLPGFSVRECSCAKESLLLCLAGGSFMIIQIISAAEAAVER